MSWGGIKQYLLAFAVFTAVDILMLAALHLTGSDFWFGAFARGQIGGFITGAVYWTRHPLWECK